MIFRVPEPMTLAELLLKEFCQASRTGVKKIIAHGNVKVNKRMVVNPATPVKPGDTVEYVRRIKPGARVKAPFPVIFEDPYLIVAEKPPGMLTVGERGQGGTSFFKEMSDHIKEISEGKVRLWVVHRLDREVSGLLVLAKSEAIQCQIKEGWPKNRKLYYALVEGLPEQEKGTIRSWLKEGKDRKVFSVREQEGARYAVTRYRVMDRTGEFALLEVELETGRKNQIRAHLSELGCPVVGDRRYGADARFVRRIRLHAFYLSMAHPVSGEPMEFRSRMPKGFLVLKPCDEKYK